MRSRLRSLVSPLVLAVPLLSLACSDGGRGTTYGSPKADLAVVPIADVLARAEDLDGKPVRVEGLVTDVCAKRGCWIEIADEASAASIMFKVQDGVMVFPLDTKGQWAVADGTVRRFVLTLEETRETRASEAAEAGRPFDPASVTEPDVFVRLDGIGARLVARR